MNPETNASPSPRSTARAPRVDLDAAVDAAVARLAPTWPLDRFIAVNPLWGFVETPLPKAAARLEALSGSRMVRPRALAREALDSGRLTRAHLEAALARSGSELSVEALVAALRQDAEALPRRSLVTDVADASRALTKAMAWTEIVPHVISQHCASYFSGVGLDVASQPPAGEGLFATWRARAAKDRAPELLVGGPSLSEHAAALPDTRDGVFRLALGELDVEAHQIEDYLAALLFDVLGWASIASYRRFMAGLSEGSDEHIVDLLAVRLAWELLLYRAGGTRLASRWQLAMAGWTQRSQLAEGAQRAAWILQDALELAYQDRIARELFTAPTSKASTPKVQAAFCIDVRSEVFRRAFEGSAEGMATLGFAGFFGLPVAYRPVGTELRRPQLPGLLSPALLASDEGATAAEQRRPARLERGRVVRAFQDDAVGGFSFVEALGLGFGGGLLASALGWARPTAHPERAGLRAKEVAGRRPRLTAKADGTPLTTEEEVDLAEGILRAMSLTRGFARLVLLAGHGSQTTNNPHAAGYDCGACCGQAGAVNARATAALMNDPAVREGLRARGIDVPDATRFLGGLHDTTTDEVTLYDTTALGAGYAADLAALRDALRVAGERTRQERAPRLALPPEKRRTDASLLRALQERARDWSEVRPEWGLAGNASFVVAPRERIRHLNLEGRAFLHDYRAEEDGEGYPVLTQILTAPMVVTHWINFQYYASTVDPARFGSGNKVLHNVVGGNLGVFEGNGGDLRIGLPMQAVHDGTSCVHEPLRLSVFVEAPRAAIEGVLEAHDLVRQLVENGWLHLLQIDREAEAVFARRPGGWASLPAPTPA